MNINSDINVLGSLSDWNLIVYYFNKKYNLNANQKVSSITSIKTDKSIKRFEKAINSTLLSFKSKNIELLFKALMQKEGLSKDTLLFLFWNAAINNDLLHYLNDNVFFPAFYSGRIAIKYDEVVACLNELKNSEPELKKWADSTLLITASKYLTLLKKFGLLEGGKTKTILHLFLNDKLFVIFVYILIAISEKSNLLISPWLKYGFSEHQFFIERIKKKQFTSYFNIFYTGDNLKIETLIEYKNIYEIITRN